MAVLTAAVGRLHHAAAPHFVLFPSPGLVRYGCNNTKYKILLKFQ